ncbi:hypothetical protein M011DRAFT_477552 [Sporormia fimetaria CBS 119925]|uniref:Transcriptional co-activator n=1 Tax=Sporormia fimetaria CBS 119925 TaxID=1340428 RepID=A0A6A6V8Z7_9PLEO|nr:hypothetical protein M011DRAFT_477552 [Sporormia fimetaria CBS 119925]
MANTIRPNDIMATTPTLSSKALPTPPSVQKSDKKLAPRIDLEPLYVAVKSAIPDADWSPYRSAIGAFLVGKLNQAELSAQLDRILTTPALDHAHNQLFTAIIANIFREPPEPGTASWADDKVMGKLLGAGSKSSGYQGDEAEKRQKHEVMQLSRRERKRLKTLPEGTFDPYTQDMVDMIEAKKIHTPETGNVSAGGFQKTNWDLEIRKRYNNGTLFVETHEFPDPSTIATRMLPICYENSLPQGHSAECPAFMNIATETYIKEALTNFFQRAGSNGADLIKTAAYKRRLEKEEMLAANGELNRTAGGLLPVEQEEMRKRKRLCMEDLRMSIVLGDSFLGQTPIIAGEILNGRLLDAPGVEELEKEDHSTKPPHAPPHTRSPHKLMNGTSVLPKGPVDRSLHTTNGIPPSIAGKDKSGQPKYNLKYHVELNEPPIVMDDDWTWSGTTPADITNLDSVLEACLNLGV